jgi:hypothetical protein
MGQRVGRLQELPGCIDRTSKSRESGVTTESLRKMKNRANFFAVISASVSPWQG